MGKTQWVLGEEVPRAEVLESCLGNSEKPILSERKLVNRPVADSRLGIGQDWMDTH